jgi:hypothetical protein
VTTRASHAGLTLMRLAGMRADLEQRIADAVTGFVRASGVLVSRVDVSVQEPDQDKLTATATVAVTLEL